MMKAKIVAETLTVSDVATADTISVSHDTVSRTASNAACEKASMKPGYIAPSVSWLCRSPVWNGVCIVRQGSVKQKASRPPDKARPGSKACDRWTRAADATPDLAADGANTAYS
jgi:hypothetical protein